MLRIVNSFIPTRHGSILKSPDIYGPLIAVFSLPQTLLLSIGVSRHGCSPIALLGNAVAISLCLWLGLSFLYRYLHFGISDCHASLNRVLAFVVSPTIGMRQCLCMVGYSFFSWIIALLCSYPLELYHPSTPPTWPLVTFGLPSAITLGTLFLSSYLYNDHSSKGACFGSTPQRPHLLFRLHLSQVPFNTVTVSIVGPNAYFGRFRRSLSSL